MSKKLIACFVILCMLFAVSCTAKKSLPADITCKQILETATAAGEQYQNVTKVFWDAQTLTPYTMSLWADGVYKECEEFSLLADYALCYSSDNTTYEISVLKAKDSNDIQKLKNVLERRKITLTGGDKAAYDPNFNNMIKDSRVLVEGNFVLLLITAYNDEAITAIENLKQ